MSRAASRMDTSMATSRRLPGLQRAIRDSAVPSFKRSRRQMLEHLYNEDKGTNYGQARYLGTISRRKVCRKGLQGILRASEG